MWNFFSQKNLSWYHFFIRNCSFCWKNRITAVCYVVFCILGCVIVFVKLRFSFYEFFLPKYLNPKLRSFGRFFSYFFTNLEFARRLTAGLGYFGVCLQRLLTCFSFTTLTTCLWPIYTPVCSLWIIVLNC